MKAVLISIVIISILYHPTNGATLGESCSKNENCQDGDTICNQNICGCPPGKKASGRTVTGNQATVSCIYVIGSKCETDSQCENLEGSECENNLCICKNGLSPNPGDLKCLSESGYREPCEAASQCIPSMGDKAVCYEKQCTCQDSYHYEASQSVCVQDKISEIAFNREEDYNSRWHSGINCDLDEECKTKVGDNSQCIYGVCQCNPRYHINNLGLCIEDRGLHEKCNASDQCFWGPQMVGKIECAYEICSCKMNYMEAHGKICIRYFKSSANGGFSFSIWMAATIGTIIHIFI